MKTTLEDLSGQKFGKLEVVCMSHKRTSSGNGIAVCNCDCGRQNVEVPSGSLKNLHTKSCGCGLTQHRQLHDFVRGIMAKNDLETVRKICVQCGQEFNFTVGIRSGINHNTAKRIQRCETCRLKKSLGTRPSKDDW